MKRNYFKSLTTLIGGLALATMCATAQNANPVNGTIYFVGGAVLNGPLSTATAFTSFFGPGGSNSSPVVLTATGDFAGVPAGTPAMFTPIVFSGPMATTAAIGQDQFGFDISHTGDGLWKRLQQPVADLVPSFWTLTAGSFSASFDINSLTIVNQTPFFLNLDGTGTVHVTGHADTTATWTLTDTGPESCRTVTFGFQVASVPEPGTAALLFCGLGSMVFTCHIKRYRNHRS